MLRITIEKVPYGVERLAYLMCYGIITNDGTGTKTSGNYTVRLNKRNDKGLYKEGRVENFPRKKSGAWKLLLLGLQDCLGESKPRGEDAMAVLLGRAGFDHWWYGIDEDIRLDIMNELNEALE